MTTLRERDHLYNAILVVSKQTALDRRKLLHSGDAMSDILAKVMDSGPILGISFEDIRGVLMNWNEVTNS